MLPGEGDAVIIGQKTLREKRAIDVMAQLKASVLKAYGHEDYPEMEIIASAVWASPTLVLCFWRQWLSRRSGRAGEAACFSTSRGGMASRHYGDTGGVVHPAPCSADGATLPDISRRRWVTCWMGTSTGPVWCEWSTVGTA